MTYASALAFVCLAFVFLVVGLITDAALAFAIAIAASAAAAGLLLRRVRARHTRTFVAEPPPRIPPSWTQESLRDVRDADVPVELEVDHVINGYRSLVAAEVLPALETLSVDELRKIIAVERNGRNRQAIIRRAEALIDLTERPVTVDVTLDPGAPSPRRRVASAARSKSHEREGRQSLKKSGPELGL
jgi:hypothetical protein